jgi:hypothetical protein
MDTKKAEARNTDKDYYECLKNAANEVGHGGGYTEWVEVYYDDFDQMEKLYRKAAELYASLREAQAVADCKERVKAKLNDESFMGNACLSYQHDFGLLPLVTKQAIENDYKEWCRAMLNNGLLDTTN